jgi:hypothetical protein
MHNTEDNNTNGAVFSSTQTIAILVPRDYAALFLNIMDFIHILFLFLKILCFGSLFCFRLQARGNIIFILKGSSLSRLMKTECVLGYRPVGYV